ncbi:hypothetical protein [Streptomyces netropsis]|uniref:Uncharacterized protein n=1 Tax=Streptomyces netropsis TaxID=55404 RepID=A0A7W7PGZ0_STRNE|nr:hypothetical protein [Streptomyces netropsis]MBB4890496.1 hypothetical protein [Streptomyces netropsis]GGR45649.1 hypothetical protein GCM10010219_58790 [Streptomyces netropsis]
MGERDLAVGLSLLLAAGGALVLREMIGPYAAFAIVASPVVAGTAGPTIARRLAVRRLRRWLRRL